MAIFLHGYLADAAGFAVFILFLIIYAMFTGLGKLLQKRQNKDTFSPSGSPPKTGGGDDEQEELRKFFEALGLPQQVPATPPPFPAEALETQASPLPDLPPPMPATAATPDTYPGEKAEDFTWDQKVEVYVQPTVPSHTHQYLATPDPTPSTAGILEAERFLAEGRTDPNRYLGMAASPPPSLGKTAPGAYSWRTIRQSLKNPADLRKAILMVEILGTPKGLQP